MLFCYSGEGLDKTLELLLLPDELPAKDVCVSQYRLAFPVKMLVRRKTGTVISLVNSMKASCAFKNATN